MEIWRVIFEDYLVSNLGNVDSLKGGKRKRLKQHLRSGYFYVTLSLNGKTKNFLVHRLVAIAFIPNPNSLPEINHKDGNKLNNSIENLEWVSRKDNQNHAVANGLQKSGEDNTSSKLTNDQVIYIRKNPDKLNLRQLSEKFGVDLTAISQIQLGKTYKNAGGTIREKVDKRISDDERQEIRRRYKAGGVTQSTLAQEFGYSPRTIWVILHET